MYSLLAGFGQILFTIKLLCTTTRKSGYPYNLGNPSLVRNTTGYNIRMSDTLDAYFCDRVLQRTHFSVLLQ